MDKEILTTTEAARILGVSVRTAQLLIEGGSIPSWKTPGGHRRVYRRDVLAVIEAGSTAPGTASTPASSALVILIARPERLADYEAVLRSVPNRRFDSFTDTHAALVAIGSRTPAAVVIEAEQPSAARAALLESLRTNPALTGIRIFVVGSSDAIRADAGGDQGMIRPVDGLSSLAAAVAPAPEGDTAPPAPFDTPPPFPIADNEGLRLRALDRSGLVDTPPDASFDRLTWLAARILGAPMALFTILTADRQWFKSRQGIDMTETPRSWAFCNHTILQDGIFVSENLATDERFADNPAVAGEPHFRFYAGYPVVDPDGFKLGSLCVIDTRPRALDETQKQVLAKLAAVASDTVRLRASERQSSRLRGERR
ncbi:excisionase family DNA-binding protein [Xanthobacteraceae bacterium Astr-EGSB]|uniref:helix-turn-helix domain-containing protein n=1 Tax=Astrobacterium formosum TaxID=3069710 RepID=UPI0027B1D0BA|nr:excisionase family DNA-binding protein [Xanthobacteraceae bacterium Astr-EGSB]